MIILPFSNIFSYKRKRYFLCFLLERNSLINLLCLKTLPWMLTHFSFRMQVQDILTPVHCDQGRALHGLRERGWKRQILKISVKDQARSILGFTCHKVPVSTTQHCHFSLKIANGCGRVPIQLDLGKLS